MLPFASTTKRVEPSLRIRFRSLLAIVCVLLPACASNTVQKIGTSSYAALAETADVIVFTSESQIKQPYEVVASYLTITPENSG